MATGLREGDRNAFLDVVRTVAIVRVVAWHTYGYAWISYVIASMPAMVFGTYRGTLWSSGGLWSTTSDLARWGLALWGSDRVVSPSSQEEMTTFLGPEFNYTGLGTFAFCPCWQEGTRLRAERWGFFGVNGALEYDSIHEIAVAIYISGTILDANVIPALDDLSARLRQLIVGRPMPKE